MGCSRNPAPSSSLNHARFQRVGGSFLFFLFLFFGGFFLEASLLHQLNTMQRWPFPLLVHLVCCRSPLHNTTRHGANVWFFFSILV